MRAIPKIAVLMALMASSLGTPVDAQARRDGEVSVRVEILNAVVIDGVTREYRVYDREAPLTLQLTLHNLSRAPIVVDQDALKASFAVRLLSTAEVPIARRWSPGVYEPGTQAQRPGTARSVVVESERGVTFIVALEPRSLPFAPGRYDLEYQMKDVPVAIRWTDDASWSGRGPSLPVQFAVVIAPPSNPAERAEAQHAIGDDAFRRGAYMDAERAYRAAITSSPADMKAMNGLAVTLLKMHRYRESIAVFEAMLPALPSRSLALSLLAQAYVAVDDDANARRVLRLSGLSDDSISTKLVELRGSRTPR